MICGICSPLRMRGWFKGASTAAISARADSCTSTVYNVYRRTAVGTLVPVIFYISPRKACAIYKISHPDRSNLATVYMRKQSCCFLVKTHYCNRIGTD